MIKKALAELDLKELSGTSFEEYIKFYNLDKGDIIFNDDIKKNGSIYVAEGRIQRIIYTKDGGEFYLNHIKGDVAGINLSLIKKYEEFGSSVLDIDMDIVAKTDAVVLFFPFEKIDEINLDPSIKAKVLERVIHLSLKCQYKMSQYLLCKNICSTEEFVIRSIEKEKITNIESSRERAEILNLNQRSLQRALKKLCGMGFIEYKEGCVILKDLVGIENYKKRFIK